MEWCLQGLRATWIICKFVVQQMQHERKQQQQQQQQQQQTAATTTTTTTKAAAAAAATAATALQLVKVFTKTNLRYSQLSKQEIFVSAGSAIL